MRPTVIEPGTRWGLPDVREVWAYRDLFGILAGRDVRLRYKQTLLGVIWVVLQPLVAAAIFSIIFGRIAKLPSDGQPYILFVMAGMLPWNFFSQGLQRATGSLIADARLITKVYFPRLIIPLASSAAVLVDFAVTLAVTLALIPIFGGTLSPSLLALPLLLLVTMMVTTGISLGLAALNVYYRDFAYVLPFVIQVWMYGSPLVYATSMVPARWLPLFALNPITGLIDGFRWCVLGAGAFPAFTLAVSAIAGVAALLGGSLIFRRVERSFADAV